uniref:RRM domain-containing protein n=1 Tax=Ciona savignyi TaxID=51511 RepID=H2ZMK4_CIOSA
MNINMREKSRTFIEESKLEFSKKCRRISIKNIPAGVLNQDIFELLKPYFYQQIHIDKNSLSCKAVLLDGTSAARCLDELNGKIFRGQRLAVSLASCDFMLCITQLPLAFTYDQFLSLITPFGTPERCFLVHSDVTGHSMGYGCVEFTSKESSIKAKNQLNGFKIQNNVLQVHWLDSIPAEYSGLYSSCLLLEDLPPGFKDQHLLIDVFSQFVSPNFCQLAQCPQNDFAVVEYADSSMAEESWRKLNGYRIGDFPLKVSFCVPGPCGLVVLNALRASRDLKRGNPCGGLLPTPVMDHLTNKPISTPMMSHQKDQLNQLNTDNFAAVASKESQVQQLLSALQSRYSESQTMNPQDLEG